MADAEEAQVWGVRAKRWISSDWLELAQQPDPSTLSLQGKLRTHSDGLAAYPHATGDGLRFRQG